MFPGVVVEVWSSAFLPGFLLVLFLANHGGGASRFGYHGAEFLLGGGVLCRVGGVA